MQTIQTPSVQTPTILQPAAKKTYDDTPLRRCVRHQELTQDGLAQGLTKSFTIDDDDIEYHPTVDLGTGACYCDCPHFTYRKAKLSPQMNQPETLCKHLKRYIHRLEQRGEIQTEGAEAAPKSPPVPELAPTPFNLSAQERSARLQGRIDRGEVSIDDLF